MPNKVTQSQRVLLVKAGYTDQEIDTLSIEQASQLIDYVVRNNYRKPSAAQLDALFAAELNEDGKAMQHAVLAVRIPSHDDVDALTRKIYRGLDVEDAISELKYAQKLAAEAAGYQGRALCRIRATYDQKEWTKILHAMHLPRATALRQMQTVEAEGSLGKKLAAKLEKKYVQLRQAMSAGELKALHSPTAVAEGASPVDASGSSGSSVSVCCSNAEPLDMIALEIAELVTDELNALPKERRTEVLGQIIQCLSAEGVLNDEEESVDAAA